MTLGRGVVEKADKVKKVHAEMGEGYWIPKSTNKLRNRDDVPSAQLDSLEKR